MPGPQNLVKLNQERSSLKFGPDFCPKLGEDPPPQKKRSSLKFGRVGPKLDGPQDPGLGTMYPLNPPLAGPVTRWGEGMTQHFVPQYTL